jgi:hypothetical protein
MNLPTSKVYKCLDKKTLVLGFEIMDLFALMLLLATLNFFAGNSHYKIVFTWVPVAIIAAVLRIAKRGKADLFLVHWLKYHFSPKVYWGFFEATKPNELLRLQKLKKLKRKDDNDFKLITRSP